MFCSNCGHEIKKGDLFCENCGTKIEAKAEEVTQETKIESVAEAAKEKVAEVQKEVKKGKKPVIIIAAIIAVLVIVGVIFAATSLFSGGGEATDTAIYYKDNQFYFISGDEEVGTLLTDDVMDDEDSYLTIGDSCVKLNKEKDGFYYFTDVTYEECGTLLFRSFKDIKKEENTEGTHIASNVSIQGWFLTDDGLVYQKENGDYYYYNIKEEKETKLVSEVVTYRRSNDRVLFINEDNDIYMADVNDVTNVEKVESSGDEYIELVDYTENFETIWFQKGGYGDRALYQKDYGKEKTKLGSGAEYYTSGEYNDEIIIYGIKDGGDSVYSYYDFINDDMLASDQMDLMSSDNYRYFTARARQELREELQDSEFYVDSYEVYSYIDGTETLVAKNAKNINEILEGVYFDYEEDFEIDKVGDISDFYVSYYESWWSISLEYWDAYYEIQELIYEGMDNISSTKVVCVDGINMCEIPITEDDDIDIYNVYVTNDKLFTVTIDQFDGDKELLVMDFDGKVIGSPETVDEDYYSTARIIDADNAIYYFTDASDGEGELHYYNGEESTLIDHDVTRYMSIVVEDDDTLMYYKDYDGEDGTATLCYYDGKESKQLVHDVYEAERVGDYIYYITNYNDEKNRGDLYRYSFKDDESIAIDYDVEYYFVIY